MKTKYWIALLAVIVLLCGGASLLLLQPGEPAGAAEIYSDGVLIKTVSLSQDQEFTVASPNGGVNTVTVQDGKIAVTQADCPDHYCMHRGFCDSGSPIVCLPNALVIQFVGEQDVDFAVG